MKGIFSKLNNKYIIAPFIMFLFFVFVLIFSLFTSRSKTFSPTPIAPTSAVSENSTTNKVPQGTSRIAVEQRLINNYITAYGPPEYNFTGTRTYGTDALVYVYLKRGLAFIADPKTTRVYEQWQFQPMSLNEFKQKYAGEILDFKIVPTLPDE